VSGGGAAPGLVGVKTYRRTVALLAAPGVQAAREVYSRIPSDVLRVAALVEMSAAAAALARTVVKLRRLDMDLIAPHVADPTDLRAVLGRGRWLPTMTRHVPEAASGPLPPGVLAAVPVSVRRRAARRACRPGQLHLFASPTGRG
jgi:hypothetical protein